VTERGDVRRVGEIVGGKYRVVRLLAAGGMGVVYEAQHTVVRRRFAVKFLRPHLVEQRESLARFQREAQAAGALESENLTAAVDFGVGNDGSPYIVMEYLVGESLQALLAREKRLPIGRAADLVAQACRGIHAAHAAGIIHRDLKPQNLFVCRREDGTDLLKVLDFGIAKLELADKGNTATRTGTVLGTPAYMSPEQARGEKHVDHGADVYALGAILYELVSGEKPHPGSSHNAILHHIATQPAVPLSVEAHALPEALAELVSRTLSSDPAQRPASAEVLGQSLAPFVLREVWPAVKSEDSAPEHTPPVSESERPARTERSRHSANLIAYAAGGVLLIAVVLLLSVDRKSSEATSDAAPPAETPPAAEPASSPAPNEAVRPEPVPALVPPAAEVPSATVALRSEPSERPPTKVAAPVISRPKRAESPAEPAGEALPRAPLGSRPVPVTFDQSNPYQ
jgi:eukaryotic-like serine/threonine-protein kinase